MTKLYHYTTYDSFYKIWVSQKLKLGKIEEMNDIYERRKMIELSIGPKRGVKEFIRTNGDPFDFIFEQIRRFRQVCFTKDFKDGRKGCLSSMMWGQYAKNEKGVCIEFNKENLMLDSDKYLFDNIDYVCSIPIPHFDSSLFDENAKDNVCNHIIENKDIVFFKKHIDWEHENEFRIVSKPREDSKDIYLSIENAITAVYVQNRESIETTILKKIVGDAIPINNISYENVTTMNLKID